MSLNLGTLTGFLDLDSSAFDGALTKAEGSLKGFGGKGAAIAGAAGLAIGAAVAAGLVGAMNVDAANGKLQAQLGLTAAESERAGKVAGSLYANAYGGSLDEVNTAVGAVISSIKGMRTASGADVEAMTEKVLNLAAGFGVDVERASQVAGQAITSGLARDGSHAMDLLTASMQKVPAAVRGDLLDAVDEYGPFMASIGVTGEQAFGLLVKASEKGMYGIDKTGDALKEFTIRATDMSTASKVGFDALGMSQEDMTNKLLQGGPVAAEAFGQIVAGLQGIKDPAAQSQAALALFGTPLEDLNTQEIPAFLASLTGAQSAMGDTAGAADTFGVALNDNASVALTSVKRQAEMAVVGLANYLLPAFTAIAAFLAASFGPALMVVGDILAALGGGVQEVTGWLREHETTTSVLAGVIAAVLIPTMVASAVTFATTAAAAVASAATQSAAWLALQVRTLAYAAVMAAYYALTLAQWATMAARMVASVAVQVGAWVLLGAQSLLAAAKVAAAWIIAMGPVAWVIAAVIGLVALIIANWDTIRRVTVQLWEGIKSATSAAWSAITGAVSSAVGAVVGAVQGAWNSVKGATSAAWAAVKSAVSAGVSAVVAVVTFMPRQIVGALGNMGGLLAGAGRAVIDGFINGITGAFGRVRDTLGRLTSMLPDWKGPATRDAMILRDAGRLVMGGFEAGLVDKFGDVRRTLGDATDLIGMSVGGPNFVQQRLGVPAAPPAAAGRVVHFMQGATVQVNDQVDMDLLLGRAEFAVNAGGL